MLLNYSKLVNLTGISHRTVKLRLERAGLKRTGKEGFESREALKALYIKEDEKNLVLAQERALLASEQSRRLKRENDIAERGLIPQQEVSDFMQEVGKQTILILESLPLNIKRRVPILKAKHITWIQTEIAKCRNIIADMKLK